MIKRIELKSIVKEVVFAKGWFTQIDDIVWKVTERKFVYKGRVWSI